jgi:hypothetical protein
MVAFAELAGRNLIWRCAGPSSRRGLAQRPTPLQVTKLGEGGGEVAHRPQRVRMIVAKELPSAGCLGTRGFDGYQSAGGRCSRLGCEDRAGPAVGASTPTDGWVEAGRGTEPWAFSYERSASG